jgi:hypothetical protein
MSGHDQPAAKPSSPMLRDEAIDYLLSRVEDDSPAARLQVNVSHGQYRALYIEQPGDPGESKTVGEWVPNLTDALASLIERLP